MGYVRVISGASGGQKKELDLLEMELQVVVNQPPRMSAGN